MAYTLSVHRSPDGTNWTQIEAWISNGGAFSDMIIDTPPSPGTWYYEFRITSNDTGDVAGIRRLVAIAGNR